MKKKKQGEGSKQVHNESENAIDFKLFFEDMLNGLVYAKIVLEKNKPVDFIFLEVNSAFEKITGLKRGDVLGKKVSEAIPDIKKAHPELFNIYGKVASSGKAETFELDFKPFGKVYNVSAYSPKKGYFIETFEDITGRKKAEEDLRDSERKRSLWLDCSPVCTKIVDLDLNLQYMSAAGVEQLKIDDITQYYGTPYPFPFYPDSFCKPMIKNLKKAKATGKTVEQEAFVNDIEGNVLWYHSTITPVKNDKGRVEYMVVVSVETTDRKKAEEKIKSLVKFPAENPNPIIRIARDGVLLFANKASQSILKERGFKIGKPVSKEWMELISAALSSSENREVEMTCCNEVFLWSIALIADADYINFYGMNITKRKEAEEAVFKQKASLEQKNIALKEILEQIEIEKQKIKDDVAATAEELLLPALDKLRMKGASRKQVKVLKGNLQDMTSSFGKKISSRKLKLTPKEIQLCNMIKEGLSTKDIANIQNISIQTIEKHRAHIRKKVGITNKGHNLTAYLQGI